MATKQWSSFWTGLAMLLILSFTITSYADVREEIAYPGNPLDASFFIHISDTHIGSGSLAIENFEAFLRYMDSGLIHPDCIVNTGDLTEGGTCFPGYGFCIPTGPDKNEWEAYYNILLRYPLVMEKYYDLPGNHDRYGQIDHWTGETGYDGYTYFGLRGSESSFDSDIKSQGNMEGQYDWEINSIFFMALNTCDETGISWFEYEALNFTEDQDLLSPLHGSDLPVLSAEEISHLSERINYFSAQGSAGLRFLFGHHPITSEIGYDPGGFTGGFSMPGLYDEKGYVLQYLSGQSDPDLATLRLLDASSFPDPQGEPVTAWIERTMPLETEYGYDYWDEFTYTGKSPDDNELTGCIGLTRLYPEGQKVIAQRLDRGARELIGIMDEFQVSAYLCGHTHTPFDSVGLVELPGLDEKALVMNTGAMKNGYFRIIAVDNGGISTRIAQIDQKDGWPVIVITAPVDAYLSSGDINPFSKPVLNSQDMVIRAFAFPKDDSGPEPELKFQVTGKGILSGWKPMVRIQAVENLYQGIWDSSHMNLSQGEYVIEVREEKQITSQSIYVQINETDQPESNYPPDAATLVAPLQSIQEQFPVFTWKKESSASWYRLYIRNESQNQVFARWYEAADICSGAHCSVVLDLQLPKDAYKWFVKSWNDYGSKWSKGLLFTVDIRKNPPDKINLISPMGLVSGSFPEFIWNTDPKASWYKIYIAGTGSEKNYEYAQWYEIADNDSDYPEIDCSDDKCTLLITTHFAAGSFKWRVKGWNEDGPGVWSDEMEFIILE